MQKVDTRETNDFFVICYLAAQRPISGHYREDSPTNLMLITAVCDIGPEFTGDLVTMLRPTAYWGLNWDPSNSLTTS